MKRKLLISIFILLACTFFVGCDQVIDIFFGTHECTYTDWYVLDESSCTTQGKEERSCIICFSTEERSIALLEHIPENREYKEATCTEDGYTAGVWCSLCENPISNVTKLPALGHTILIDEAIEPTEFAPGKTEGKHCSACGEIIVKQASVFYGNYSNAEMYDGNYAYTSLLQLENGENIQAFYNYIDEYADAFHSSGEDAKTRQNSNNTFYYAAEIYFDDFGLTSQEAITAWSAYRIDHPLYYWISGNVSYSDTFLSLLVYEEYADGDIRTDYNEQIYELVQRYINALDGESQKYLITLAFHDMIIHGADYLYEADGVTPSSKASAHNIIGVLLDGAGVCESYTKAFQLLLNYCSIDNIYVVGEANEPHAWNLVNLDSGWYWYDLTWDDTPDWGVGVRHSYFCVNDIQNVNWQDGAENDDPHGFLVDHTPYTDVGLSINYSYALPKRADTVYCYGGELIRDNTIVVDDLHYVINGYNTVSLTKIEAEGDVIIPETITYKGYEYTVVSIGIFEDGFFKAGNILKYDPFNYSSKITSISIPKTVRFIWDYAFDYSTTIKEYIVDEDNQFFTSLDGVLYSKSLYTLIKFPLAKNVGSYTIPYETVEIAYSSFGDGGIIIRPSYLRTLIIGDNVSVIGAGNFGKGYRDGADTGSNVVMIDGYLQRMKNMFTVVYK